MKLPTLRQTLMIGRRFFLKPFQSHPKVSGTELQTQQLSEHFDLKFSTFRPAFVKNLWSTPHLKFSVMFSVYLFFQKNTQYTTHLTSLDSPILQKMNPIFQRHTNTIHLKHGDHFNDLFPPVNFRRQTSPRTRFVAECFIPQKCFFHFSRACFVESANKLLQIFFPKRV